MGEAKIPASRSQLFRASPVGPSFPGAGSFAPPRTVAAGPGRAPLRSGEDTGGSVQRRAEPAGIPLCSLAVKPLQHFSRFVPASRGLSPCSRSSSIRLAAQGELQPLTAAALGCLPIPHPAPRQTVPAAAKGCRPAAGSGCRGKTLKQKKKKERELRAGGGRGHVAAGAAGRNPAPVAQTAKRNARRDNAPSGGKFHPPVTRRSLGAPGRA